MTNCATGGCLATFYRIYTNSAALLRLHLLYRAPIFVYKSPKSLHFSQAIKILLNYFFGMLFFQIATRKLLLTTSCF